MPALEVKDGENIRQSLARCRMTHDGIAKMGIIADHECGIFGRIHTWLDALGVGYDIDTGGRQWLLRHQGKYQRYFSFNFALDDESRGDIPCPMKP